MNKTERTDLKYFNNSKAFIEYSNDMEDFQNIESSILQSYFCCSKTKFNRLICYENSKQKITNCV